MPTRDQLELIGPGGEIRFYDLDPAKGLTNIGRHPDNDIVIDNPAVAPFHAVLYHRQKPYQIILMAQDGKTTAGGRPLQPRTSHTLQNWDTIELDGFTLVLLEDSPAAAGRAAPPVTSRAAAAPPADIVPLAAAEPVRSAVGAEAPPAEVTPGAPTSTAAPAAVMLAPPPDKADELILAEVSAREFTLDVEQTASFDVSIANGGDIVATFMVAVEGVDPEWVLIAPAQVNLFEGERTTVNVTITPPRRTSSRAGIHYIAVTVTSPEHPGHFSRTSATLVINPYYEHAVSELSPRQQKVGWRKRAGKVNYTIANHGNGEAAFRIDASDDERACQFEFKVSDAGANLAKQAELRLSPEESRPVGVFFTVLTRRFFGLTDHFHSFTVTTTPLQGQQTPRSVLGQIQSSPLIGPWHVALAALLLAVLIAIIFRPRIQDFTADPDQVLSSEIMSGKTVTLSWQASWFSKVSIDQGVGAVQGSEGSVDVSPLENTTYRLTASTPLLELLYRNWFSATRETTVLVDPVEPIVRFNVDKDKVVTGESVTLSWQVLNAEEIVLVTNGAPETLPLVQSTGTRVVAPEGEMTFTLRAKNRYTTGDGIIKTIVVNATRPTQTPLPPPVIQRFDVLPSTIIEGEEVTIEWSVTGVDQISIDGKGNFPPSGKLVEKPTTTTSYRLIANNGQTSAISLKEVTVNPAPTPTPVPGTPKIDFFTAVPSEVNIGSDEANNIQLAWSVSGDVTSIELSGESLGKIAGLERQGTRVVSVGDKDTQFILTAFNQSLSASQTVQITVKVPVPVISSLNPTSGIVGGPAFTLTVTGANFVSGSTVRWNGVDRPTTFVSNTQLSASIPSSDISKSGTYQVTVFNPAESGGGASGAQNFAVNNPQPVLNSVTPNTTLVGGPDTTIVVTGSGFISDSKVRWNGVDLPTTYSTGTTLTAVVSQDKTDSASIATVTVFNPQPLGGSSGPLTFTVANPVPRITSLGPPSAVAAGGPAFELTILGSGFVGGTTGSRISWNGDLRSAIFDSDSQLRITIPSADIAVPALIDVAVVNPEPGGGPSNTLTFTVPKNATKVNLSIAPGSGVAVTGQSITLTAQVTPNDPSVTLNPTGIVTFKSGSTVIGSAALSGSPPTGAYTTTSLGAGSYNLTAEYSGDSLFDIAVSSPQTYAVNKANVTITLSSTTPSTYGDAVNFTANVTAAAPGSDTPARPNNGTAQLYVDGVAVGSPVTVTNGTATLPTTATQLVAGSRSITATYDGSTDVNFASGSTPSPYAHVVNQRAPTTTVSNISPSPSTYGSLVTFTATVNGGTAGTPQNGATVTFFIDGASAGTGTLNSGTASYQTSQTQLTGGGHTITAQYSGALDPNFADSPVSNGIGHTVNRATVNISLGGTAGSQPAQLGSWTATVTTAVGVGTPTGSVTFYYSSRYSTDKCSAGPPWEYNSPIAVPLSGSPVATATRTESITSVEGAFQIYAVYNGDTNFASQTSNTVAGTETPCTP